jgi:hypothetical protein
MLRVVAADSARIQLTRNVWSSSQLHDGEIPARYNSAEDTHKGFQNANGYHARVPVPEEFNFGHASLPTGEQNPQSRCAHDESDGEPSSDTDNVCVGSVKQHLSFGGFARFDHEYHHQRN